jgi:hypothetical protein
MLRMVVAAVNGGCSSRAVFRRILSSSSRSFCAAIGKVEVLAGESALSVERERAMASFACIVLSIGTFTINYVRSHEIVRHKRSLHVYST